MLIVPLRAVPSQTLQVTLNNQITNLSLYQKQSGLYMDVSLSGQTGDIVSGVICQNLNRIIRSAYLGYSGDFEFFDTQGTSDPTFDGLGSRYLLIYLTAAEIAAAEAAADALQTA